MVHMRLNSKNSFLLGYAFVMLIFWAGMYASGIKLLTINKVWGIGINFLPLFGGIFGLYTSRYWGGFKSAVGKGIILIALGLISWSLGNWIWSYYNFFLASDIPYPSWADAGYIAAVPLWAAGMFYLSKATGAKFALRNVIGKLYLIFLPLVTLAASYYLLVSVARGGSITAGGGMGKVFFDFAYPLGDVVIVTLALLILGLSSKYLGGRYRWPVLVTIFGFLTMFFADFSFSYTTTLGSYYDGHPNNLLFVAALGAIGFGISSFDTKEVE